MKSSSPKTNWEPKSPPYKSFLKKQIYTKYKHNIATMVYKYFNYMDTQ